MADKDFRHVVRVAKTDINGNKNIVYALRKIKGVGINYAHMACKLAGIDVTKKAGHLLEAEAQKLEEVILNPAKFSAPEWMYNRRKDIVTGADKHIVSADLIFIQDNDIKTMKKTKSYKGLRHQAGLTVRGQQTKANFRRNKKKASLGVLRRKGAKKGK